MPTDGQLLVASVAELLRRQPCRQCLLWCKADEVVELLHEELPEQLLGYVAMPAEADRAGLPPLRLAFPQVCATVVHGDLVNRERSRAGRIRGSQWHVGKHIYRRTMTDPAGTDPARRFL